MQATVDLDDKLMARAQEYTGLQDESDLIRAALTALIEREAARSLARMGGSEPGMLYVPRRRSRK